MTPPPLATSPMMFSAREGHSDSNYTQTLSTLLANTESLL